jgi:2-dehydropantoate 2-reductase
MAPAEGPIGVWERRFEIETIPRLQDKSFGLRPEFQLSLEKIDELLAFVAEIGKLGEGFSLELHQKRFHVLPRLLIGEGLIIVAACLPSEMPGIDHLAFIASDQDHFLLRITVLKEEADADVEGLGDLEKGSDRRGDDLFFNLREKGLGKARSIREVLKDEPFFLSKLPDLPANMEGFDLVSDGVVAHEPNIALSSSVVKGFFVKTKKCLILLNILLARRTSLIFARTFVNVVLRRQGVSERGEGMKIVVVGAGAMGSLFGGLLAHAGEEVCLVDLWKAHIEAIQSQGLILEEPEGPLTLPLRATTDVASAGKADLVLLFVKAYDTERAVTQSLVLEKEDTLFLSLQNGLGNGEVISQHVDPSRVLLGVTNHGATVLGPGRIRHAGRGKSYLGALRGGRTNRLEEIARVFCQAGLETELTEQIEELIWEKLLVNVGINALAALTGLKNGELLDHPETLMLMEAMVSEAAQVARAKGIRIHTDPFQKVIEVARATGANRCSMGQDLDHRRRTEIDVINGAVVREAKRLGIPVPYNEMITALVKVIERRF